jgi:hypothetical protein
MLRNRRHRSLYITIHVRDVIDLRVVVDDRRVVDIRYLGDVHRRIRDIHAVHVRRAHTISRDVNFARTEREPCHVPTDSYANSSNERN